jgi:structural maintenance of chromosome 1
MPVILLEVENFKSYGGKHIIGPFSDHFTSIIGPNGCGKSNLMDAISFVFGLHASSLRSHQLRDLIYRSATTEIGADSTNPASKDDSRTTNDDEDTSEAAAALSKRTKSKKANPTKRTQVGQLKCSVTLVYESTEAEERKDDMSAQSNDSVSETRFTRSILPNGSCEYHVNHRLQNRNQYEEALHRIGVLVNVRNCFVFQGDVENLARKNPVEMISLFEAMSGSIEYKKEYDTLYHQKEELEQQQKLIVQQKKVFEHERQQYKTQKLEADQFHTLVEQRNSTLSDFYLWQLYHIDQDRVEKENAAAALQEQLHDAVQQEDTICQEVQDHKKDITKLRRTTSHAEKNRMKHAAIYDEYEPTRIQITEEMANLQKKLEQDQKALQKKIQEETKYQERLHKLQQDIVDYQQTERDLTKQYEEEKSKLLSSVTGVSPSSPSSTTAVQLTAQQEEEYVGLRELANQASMEPRRILQQQQRKFDTAQNTLTSLTAEYDEIQKSYQQVQQEVIHLTERSGVLSKVRNAFQH